MCVVLLSIWKLQISDLFFIFRANEEIAEVRGKNKAEISALQVQLRREQLKVQSLEKSLDQKVSKDSLSVWYII